MRPTYDQELESLKETYAVAVAADVSELALICQALGSGSASFVASGGMAPVARLAADLHESSVRQPASALTPLQAISRPALIDCGVLLLTSSGKHPDAHEVMRRLGRPGLRPAGVLTHRLVDELPPMDDVRVATLPPLSLREGFLAVNSVMSMAVAMIRAYLGDVLPGNLPALPPPDGWLPNHDRLIVLHPPELASVAADLETRLVEIGLAAVQVVDFRNFAHGRHTGLSRNAATTSVLALSGNQSAGLAEATLATLPEAIDANRWHTDLEWPLGVLQLLQLSMRLCGDLGARAGVNVARPAVPEFGRKLYRLPVRRRLPDILSGPIDRKVAGMSGPDSAAVRATFERSLNDWMAELTEQRFGSVVLDYDGTVCSTAGRFEPPSEQVATALNRMLGHGVRLGFASGRGPSLHTALRAVIDPEHWSEVQLGLYNGGVLIRLDEEPGDLKQPSPSMSSVESRLQDLSIAEHLSVESRCAQVTVELTGTSWARNGLLSELVADVIAQPPAIAVKVVASGHSVDVVPLTTSKVRVINRIRHLDGPVGVLAIGDQGQIGGNDFELLAHEPWSLSVDRCSADPSRCWYLGRGDVSGPNLLVRYLNALRPMLGGMGFRGKDLL